MRFWDASAVVPLLVREPSTDVLLELLRKDDQMMVWWGTRVECVSALMRRFRPDGLDAQAVAMARAALDVLTVSWSEVQPTSAVRSEAEHLLAVHPLRSVNALQLAAAIVWCDAAPTGRALVCLDSRLREAAQREGFAVQPSG